MALPHSRRPAPRPVAGLALDHAIVSYGRRHPGTSLNLGALAQVSGSPPTIAELRRHLERNLAATPELAWCLNEPGLRPTWKPLPDWTIADHLREWCVPACRPDGWRDAAARILAAQLSSAGPLWECWLIRGYSTDEWSLLWKAHHLLFDGTSMIEFARRSLGAPAAKWRYGPSRWAPQGLTTRGAALKTISRHGLGYLGSFLPPPKAVAAPAMAATRKLASATVELSHLRQIAASYGATVNDVVLATITGALREWTYQPYGPATRQLRAIVPVDTRSPADVGRLGNWVANIRVALPYDEPDSGRRILAVAGATARAKQSAQPHVAWAALQALPRWFARTFFDLTLSPGHADLLVSNWGLTERLSCLEHPVDALVPLMFVPSGHPFAIGIASHDGRTHLGIASTDECGDPGELCQLWQRGVNDLAWSASRPGARQDAH